MGDLDLRISVDTRSVQRTLNDLTRKQLPFATAMALNATAKIGAEAVRLSLPSTFDHVAPFTRAAFATKPATKASLEATVLVKPLQAKYLGFEEFGGTRTPADNTRKQSQALVVRGQGKQGLPRGYLQRLADKAAADKATRDELRQLREAGYAIERSRRRGKSRVGWTAVRARGGIFKMSGHGPHDKGPGGFFLRMPDHKLKRLVSFVPSAEYSHPKFGFRARLQASVHANFSDVFQRELAKAIASARQE